jgi:diaminopimelate epimerase
MHGAGNDYIYVNCFEETVENPEELAIKLSDRHFGIGGDGVILIMPSKVADFRMRMFNNDGSEGVMCGNGTRCIGKYVYDNRLTTKKLVTLETLGGVRTLQLYTDSNDLVTSVTVDMGKAILKPSEIPVKSNLDTFIDQPVVVNGDTYRMTCVSMGNPHAVIFMPVGTIANLDLERMGTHFEHHEIFPNRVNTEFVEVVDSHTLNMRVWERGSGETLACGTGTCASVVASVLNGYCNYDEEVLVHLRGGDITIKYQKDGTVYMTGGATKVFDGVVDVK